MVREVVEVLYGSLVHRSCRHRDIAWSADAATEEVPGRARVTVRGSCGGCGRSFVGSVVTRLPTSGEVESEDRELAVVEAALPGHHVQRFGTGNMFRATPTTGEWSVEVGTGPELISRLR